MSSDELVLTTPNVPSIHYGTGDYIHVEDGGNEAWQHEVIRDARFVDRWLAETDSSILQLIPYVVCLSPEGRALSYRRSGGGEKRLEEKRSVGVGGHINPVDLVLTPEKGIAWDTVRSAAIREIGEEIYLDISDIERDLRELGTIYVPSDDGGDVRGPGPTAGEVHIGILYALQVQSEEVTPRENCLADARFISDPSNILKYEKWSQYVIKNLPDIKECLK